MSPGLWVVALLAEAGLCGPVTPEASRDPAAAAPYVEVAEAEQAAGNRETALVAWREVLRKDPRNARARAALKVLCQDMGAASREAELTVRLESEYDSNVDLAPDGTRRPGESADGVGTGHAELRLSPWGQWGPYARLFGYHRGHLGLRDFDLSGVGGALGWAHGGPALRLSVEYGFDALALGGAPYLLMHRLRVGARAPVGPLVLEASWAGRREDFLEEVYAGYAGWRNTARLDAEWSPVELLTLSAGWYGAHLQAREVALGFLEHGPRVGLHLRLGSRLRLLGEVGYTLRGYRGFDASLGVRRRDGYRDASAGVEWDVAASWSLQLSASWRGASSNVAELAHARFAGGLGLVGCWGLW